MIGSVIVRERDGKPFRVVEDLSGVWKAQGIGKGRNRTVRVSPKAIGKGYGYVVAEPDPESLARAQELVNQARRAPSGRATSTTRRGNPIAITVSPDRFTVQAGGRTIYGTGYESSLIHKLACWGAPEQQ